MEELLANPVRFLQDAPLLFVVYVAFVRPVHSRIFAFMRSLARNQQAIADELGVKLPEDTGTFVLPADGLESKT